MGVNRRAMPSKRCRPCEAPHVKNGLYQKFHINATFPKAFNYRVLTLEYVNLSQVSRQHWEKESGIKSCLTKSREKGVVNLQTLAHFLEGTNC